MKIYTLFGDRLEDHAILQQRSRSRCLILGNVLGRQTQVEASLFDVPKIFNADAIKHSDGSWELTPEKFQDDDAILVIVKVHPGMRGELIWEMSPSIMLERGTRTEGDYPWFEGLLKVPVGGRFSLQRTGTGFPEGECPKIVFSYLDRDAGPKIEKKIQ